MKVVKTVFIVACLSAFIAGAAFIAGCESPSEPVIAYKIGEEHNFGGYLIKVEDDKQNERFIYSCKAETPQKYPNFFNFILSVGAVEDYINSDEFSYADDAGAIITFDVQGYHYFYGDKVIYISYARANENIKESIASGGYSIEIGSHLFVLYDDEIARLRQNNN